MNINEQMFVLRFLFAAYPEHACSWSEMTKDIIVKTLTGFKESLHDDGRANHYAGLCDFLKEADVYNYVSDDSAIFVSTKGIRKGYHGSLVPSDILSLIIPNVFEAEYPLDSYSADLLIRCYDNLKEASSEVSDEAGLEDYTTKQVEFVQNLYSAFCRSVIEVFSKVGEYFRCNDGGANAISSSHQLSEIYRSLTEYGAKNNYTDLTWALVIYNSDLELKGRACELMFTHRNDASYAKALLYLANGSITDTYLHIIRQTDDVLVKENQDEDTAYFDQLDL